VTRFRKGDRVYAHAVTGGAAELAACEEWQVQPLPQRASFQQGAAIGVNPAETYVRDGKYPSLPSLPFIPGTELAGEIAEGPRKGERVFALGTAGPAMTGTYAELAVVRAQNAYPLPDHLSFEQGAAVPVAFGTAWRALHDRGALVPGETVLVHGASGGVGSAAVQLASAAGAVVIGTASTAEGRDAVKADGARLVVDHRVDGYRGAIRDFVGERGVNLIVEMLANVNLDNDLDLLAKRGRVVVVGNRGRIEIDPRQTMARDADIRGMTIMNLTDPELQSIHRALGAALEAKVIRPIIDTQIPLAQAACAHREVLEGSSRGKIILTP
jgi:NADPH2:quinone reductase